MFLKIVNKNIFNINSIRARLTLFYASASMILLTIGAFFLYWITLNIIHQTDYEFLSDEADTIQYILENKSIDQQALYQAVIDAPQQMNGSIYRYYIRIFTNKKEIMLETPGMNTILAPEKYFSKQAELRGKKRFFWYSKNEKDYLLIQAPIKFGHKNITGLIQIALDLSYQHAVIHDHRILIIALLLGIICSLSLGFLMANKGIRSLYTLTKTVQNISVVSLGQRIDPKHFPNELTKLARAFNQMLDRIEASFTRLKQFSADLSHELRTPITNLIGETEMALVHASSVNEFQHVMGSNLEELQRIASLIENILFLAKTENIQQNLPKIYMNIREELMQICDYFSAMAEEKNNKMTIAGDGVLLANQNMFRRLISNLLSNSLKYSHPESEINFIISAKNNHLIVELHDQGVGIAAEHLPKIFDRFYRVDSSRTQEVSGVGLGLAIAKSIVELHGGHISIVSEIGEGTSVFLTFPT
ncbi:MAG: hypothetical protein ACD_46C00599G0002 [uncultured bacterium]|nr:MAG: hypothetical protein ACD_46C00599G0002 [uncultured bacterium]